MGWGKPFSKKGWGTKLAKVATVVGGTLLGGPLGGAAAGAAVGGMGGGGIKGAGTSAGTAMSGGFQGATQGTGLLGGLTRGVSSLGSMFGGGAAGGSSMLSKTGNFGSLLNAGSSIYSGINQNKAQGDARDDLLEGQERARAALAPYGESGLAANQALAAKMASGELGGKFNPGDLTNDPGYKFNLAQGEQALQRRQSASGNMFSGAALKEAQDYGQGLADKTYGDAYQRWLQGQQNTYNQYSGQSAAGQNAAAGLGGIYNQMGETNATAGMNQSNTLNQSLAALLSGSGSIGQKKPVIINGQVMYV